MSLEMTSSVQQGVVTLTLSGDADSSSAGRISESIEGLSRLPLRKLVLELANLTYLSSAGLRCLVFAHQKLGRDVEIVIADASEEVARTIRLAGFHTGVTMSHRLAR
jgi:anti-sigma B factor antagonist